MFCTHCGNKLEPGEKFCTVCGTKVRAEQTGQPATPAQVSQSPHSEVSSRGTQSLKPHVEPRVVSPASTQVPAPIPFHDQSPYGPGPVSTADPGVTAPAVPMPPKRKARIPLKVVIPVAVVVAALVVGVCTWQLIFHGVLPRGSANDYSWDDLSKIANMMETSGSEDAALGVAKTYHLVGSDGTLGGSQTKDLTLSDGTVVSMQIVGFYHDDKADGGKAGISFVSKDVVTSRKTNTGRTNAGGWAKSELRSWLGGDFMNELPSEVQKSIVKVNKLTNNVGKTADAKSVSTTTDSVWAPSVAELFGNEIGFNKSDYKSAGVDTTGLDDVLDSEGTQYQLYSDVGVQQFAYNPSLVKNLEGSPCKWSYRSCSGATDARWRVVDEKGDATYEYDANGVTGVVIGFCI